LHVSARDKQLRGNRKPARESRTACFPGAESKPEVARAVEAYYKPGIARTQSITASVFETPAAFQKVSDFYRPRMD
jgi:hypothetical protein